MIGVVVMFNKALDFCACEYISVLSSEFNNFVVEMKCSPKQHSKYIWVLNLTHNVRANDLKNIFW